MEMKLTLVGMPMYTPNSTGYKDLDANLQQPKSFGLNEYKWYTNITKWVTIEAKNKVAETVVAPFPLVATWSKTF